MKGKGMFVYDVFDLVINNEQLPILKKLKENSSENYIWVTDEIIQGLGHDQGAKRYKYEITPHTKYAQNLKWNK